jgi:hypothetical protein
MLGVILSYFVEPDSRLEAYTGVGTILAGIVVYALLLRNPPPDQIIPIHRTT